MTEFMRPTVTTEEVNDTVARIHRRAARARLRQHAGQLHASRAALLAGRG